VSEPDGLPALVIRIAFETEPVAFVDCLHEGDELRLRRSLERSRYRDAISLLAPGYLPVASGAVA
jgi:hypothetical protein